MNKKVMMTEEQAKSLAAGADDAGTRRLRDRIHNLASLGKTYSTPADHTPWRTVDMASSSASGSSGGSLEVKTKNPRSRIMPEDHDDAIRRLAAGGATPAEAAMKLGMDVLAARGAFRRLGLDKNKQGGRR